MILLLLCWSYFKTGLFSIGGGLATIPFLYEMSDKFGWFTHDEILDMLAISESTPGPIGVNMATYAGYTTTGHLYGGILTALSLVLPSFLVILVVARLLDKFRTNRFVNGTFELLRPASTALIASAGFGVILSVFFDVEEVTLSMFARLGEVFTHVNWVCVIVFAVVLFLMRFKPLKNVHPIAYIALCAIIGIIFKL